MNKTIQFSPPDITQKEIDEVIDTLKSGWITTGPKTKRFEKEIATYCGCEKVVCLNSATAGLEVVLRLFDIGEGDEVITTPYTFAATINVILHTGATPVLVDLKPNEFNIDPQKIKKAITKNTKAIIPVDIGGFPCDYDEIFEIIKSNNQFKPKSNTLQQNLGRILVLADSAHSFGASYDNKKIGNVADFTVFSFHAVKNLTTAEGGAITFNSINDLASDEIYKKIMLLSLHGQSKDALEKFKSGGWQYDIALDGYKYNMTDIAASIGLIQLARYETEIIPHRKKIYELYQKNLSNDSRFILPPFFDPKKTNCYHLFPLRINNTDEPKRNEIISKMAEKGVSVNVHFIPIPLHSFYKKIGFDIKNYPLCYDMYKNEISLPIHSKLTEEDVNYICDELKKLV
ncbi:MAG: capsular biosynthesis protein [Spirochaetes bacterium GWD1_27_9]|nr:MAG: capsular biosynthesis protein [Spirochaetes bacterium GWB1_27_13]OHD26497.1 MAG: capsular biosynthesis protein [Spirochaetes bacterium GWC1_27_15]OHD42039.1 MAG: capsular biosynthesis protein [Spirochaetes bacterium GWD1_27_9]